jgi:hypothetical protein
VAVATLNDEDDDHAAVTAALAGGPGPVRRAKIALSAVVAAQLAVVGIALAAIRAPLAPGDLAAGVVADLAAILGGVALGAVCARPFLARTGSALLAICLVTLGELAVPGAPPVHLVLAALGGGHPHWPGLASGLAAGLGLFAAAASLTPG